MKQPKFTLKRSVLCLMLCGFSAGVWAEEAQLDVQLNEVQVRGTRTAKQLGKEKVTREKLDQNLVQDIRDMVRYDPGISVVEGGRAGSNGFAIRGVDKDRVAITVDGLSQAESRSSEAFQELFGAYGNFNTNRNAAELENISEVAISKGADSLAAGSGALGGAVMYQTKSPSDYVDEDKPFHFGLKGGYTSKTSERLFSTSLAGYWKGIDALFVYTGRQGHEMKNHSKEADADISYTFNSRQFKGVNRGIPDPQTAKSKSTLLKLGYHFNDSNYLSGVYEDYRQDKYTHELSNLFSFIGSQSRYRNDVSYRDRLGFEYENKLDHQYAPWDKIKISADKQSIKMTTMTWDVPDNYATAGRSTEADFKRRDLNQDLKQVKLKADKNFAFGENDWLQWNLSYGGGLTKGRNHNANLEYTGLVFYPDILASNRTTTEFLVSAKRNEKNVFLDNAWRLGKYVKLGLGARYDSVSMSTLESDSLNANVRRELEAQGLWQRKAKFKAPSYAVSLDVSPLNWLTLQAKYSTAFRAPTTDEMWFYFPNREFFVKPNPDLQDERSKNVEVGVDFHGKWGNLKVSGFKTNYRNFIDFVYHGGTVHPRDSSWISPTYRNENLSRAQVKGLEVQGMWRLDSVGLPKGTFGTLAASYQKGHASGTQAGSSKQVPINALQPFNGVIGLGYQEPEGKWSLVNNVSYFARKKPEDTSRSYEQREEVFPYARHSRNVWLWDLIGHYQIGKHVTLRAGVFNILNEKYLPWDTLRSIREFGAVNRVNNCTNNAGVQQHDGCPHAGINRFTAPGRNYAFTVEAKW
ncbi:MAG: TonB-dependent hemoglobin/transferrin/lactoferrin family receptor [Neisseria sp.]|nr:TonB-dependent hemoglobin/transferrin/lactoferrin family receptor [Neisseria sp.]